MTWLPIPVAEWEHIAVEECLKYDLPWKDLMGRSRFPDHVAVRHRIWRRMRKEARMSYQQIGKVFGGYDHSTVMHACGYRKGKNKK